MITKETIEKAATDWFNAIDEKHSENSNDFYVPGTFTELWIPKEATPERAFEAGVKWALEEIEKVKK